MIGVLLVTHGPLGDNLIDAAAHVLGSRPQLMDALDVSSRAEPTDVEASIIARMRALDGGDGVLVLTDIYGATPGNIALRLLAPGRVEGISGVNLPMLVRALTYRELGLAVVVQKALSGGTEGVIHMTTDRCNASR